MQSVVQEFDGRARFVEENYGESELAKRFGVRRYPAIFVNDVATPALRHARAMQDAMLRALIAYLDAL